MLSLPLGRLRSSGARPDPVEASEHADGSYAAFGLRDEDCYDGFDSFRPFSYLLNEVQEACEGGETIFTDSM